MALNHATSIVTNGLVLYYDMYNTQKSWRGAPTTNVIAADFDTTFESLVEGDTVGFNNQLGSGNYIGVSSAIAYYSNKSLKINNGTGGTARVYKSTPVLLGEYTTVSCWVHSVVAGPYLAIEYFGGDYTWGVAQSRNTHTGTGWEKLYVSTTIAATSNTSCYYFFHPGVDNTNTFWDFIQVEKQSYATAHVNGTRTNTQAILDLTNNNILTATSLTYASDNTFSFNGSNNYITASNTSMVHGTSGFTYSCWVNFASLPGSGTLFENGLYTNGILIRFENNLIHIYSEYAATSYNGIMYFTPTIGLWYNIVLTRVDNILYLYSNGIQISSTGFGSSINIIPSTNLLYIGMSQHQFGQCFDGKIANVAVYTRALSAAEVQQNFNALRGRYLL